MNRVWILMITLGLFWAGSLVSGFSQETDEPINKSDLSEDELKALTPPTLSQILLGVFWRGVLFGSIPLKTGIGRGRFWLGVASMGLCIVAMYFAWPYGAQTIVGLAISLISALLLQYVIPKGEDYNAPKQVEEISLHTPVSEPGEEATIYLCEEGKEENTGPFPVSHVRNLWLAGKIAPGTLAWKEGLPDWKPVTQLFI